MSLREKACDFIRMHIIMRTPVLLNVEIVKFGFVVVQKL